MDNQADYYHLHSECYTSDEHNPPPHVELSFEIEGIYQHALKH